MSYGSYRDAFLEQANDFDYWFLIEDDYIFTIDNFDKLFINNYSRLKSIGWLVAGDVECGLTSTKVLKDLIDRNSGTLTFAANDSSSQLKWAKHFSDAGYLRHDILKEIPYSAGYWEHRGHIWRYGKPNSQPILMPLQSILKNVYINTMWKER